MTQPPVILLALKPILRDEIEHVADLGWVTPIWTLREWVYKLGWTNPPPGALGIDMDKLNRHFDLLYIFTAAAAEDITEWTRQTLLYELKDALSLIKNSPYLATNEYQFLLIYDEVLARVELFSESSPAVDASVLLSLADTCFEIMVELERFPYPTLP